ncbi:SOS response-associated peptidase family protein [Mesorhizobium sp. 113-3-3]|uniref:SOS response-associated peptidase family protein n=1 Tax=Mesorhizobium sp. 113-3-3 TaxID=2744516 RepID=UPI0018EC16BA|nr:SOS response-associated peptidase family protein [Mesorhizobium sp. 113-3-3]BCG83830.1 hypothetical protein MesoLj113b_73720 [Mesorhizobium sp. 113-3-3]
MFEDPPCRLTAPAEIEHNDAPRRKNALLMKPFLHGWGQWQSQAAPVDVAGSVLGRERPKVAMFNARIEGIDTAPPSRDAFKSKCCLISGDGFYEWAISGRWRKGSLANLSA